MLSSRRLSGWACGKETLDGMVNSRTVAYIGIHGYVITRQPTGGYLSTRTNIFVDYMTLL